MVVRRSALQRSRATGSLGRSPEPFLHPFVGTKGCPRRVGVPTKAFYKIFPAEGACKSFFPRRHMTSGAVIFSIARVFSSTVAVARHRAARAAQTAESSHFTRQFW